MPMEIIFRTYDEGIAFCYQFPGEGDDFYTLCEELTGFDLLTPGNAWIQPYDTLATWVPAYEYGYVKDIKIGGPPPMTTGWGFPALFNTKEAWVMLTETGLYENYAGTHLDAKAENGLYGIEFPGEWENYGLGKSKPMAKLPWKTPWRVIITGKTLAPIVESNLVYHLAKPNQLQETDWVTPGKASWSWWGDHTSGKNFKKLKDYVDFAKQMGWKYSLVDADWHIMEGGTVQELVKHANQQGIGIFLWYNSGGPHTKVMNAGPRDLMHDPEIRQAELKKISEWDVKGIKVDFLKTVPVIWDEIYFIDGYPGKDAVLARKKDETYYVAVINSEKVGKEFTFTTSFLPEDKKYEMEIIRDGQTEETLGFESKNVTSISKLSIPVLPAGGFVATIKERELLY